jgi:hypothetical protein
MRTSFGLVVLHLSLVALELDEETMHAAVCVVVYYRIVRADAPRLLRPLPRLRSGVVLVDGADHYVVEDLDALNADALADEIGGDGGGGVDVGKAGHADRSRKERSELEGRYGPWSVG